MKTAKRNTRHLGAIACAVLVLCGPAMAQNDDPIQEIGDRITFNLSPDSNYPLKTFIELCHEVTGRVFIYEETELTNKFVKLVGAKTVSKAKFYDFFQVIMILNDLACLPIGSSDIEVIQITNFRTGQRGELTNRAPVVRYTDLDNYRDRVGEIITTTIPLVNIDARQTFSSLRQYFTNPQYEQITPIDNSNSLVVTAFAPSVWAMSRLIQWMDVKPESQQLEFETVELENAVAEELEPILSELLDLRSSGRRGFAGGAPRPDAGQGGVAALEPIETRVIPDARTNSLILYGTGEANRAVKDLIDQLDREIDLSEGFTHIYQLKNSRASDLAQTLNELIQGRQDLLRQSGRRAGGGGLAGGQPTIVQEQQVFIVPDQFTNSLLISASKTKYAELREVIQSLDQRRPQVLIEAVLVEITADGTNALGVELAGIDLRDPATSDGNYQRPFGLTSFGLSTLVDDDGDGLPDSRQPNPGAGLTGGIFDGREFALPLLLQAIATRNDSNVLQMPSILTNDNTEATITAERAEPTTTFSTTQAGTDNTAFGGFETAGIDLTISPSISEENYLRLDITLNIEQFVGASPNPSTPPPKVIREVQTQVTVPDNFTVVIGGVITDSLRTQESKIPLLGDLPLLGFLFRSKQDTVQKTNLYFFVTPHILYADGFEDLKHFTEVKKKAARDEGGQVDRVHTYEDPEIPAYDPEFLQKARQTGRSGYSSQNLNLPRFLPPRSGERTANDEEIERLRRAREEAEAEDR
ncbi:MAG: secretin N-terminal domain-containing protein [Planctomycetota bacterium]